MMKITDFSDGELIQAVRAGRLVAFPTETVYGLGVRYDLKPSFDELVRIKRRPPDKPFTLMCGKIEDIEKYAYVDENIKRVINAFMPGPITLLLKPKEHLFPWVTLNSPTIGVRVPGMEELCQFINKVGVPLLVPSANKSGEAPCLSSKEVIDSFQGEIEYVVEGNVKSTLPSTIVDLSMPESVNFVRQGEVSFDNIVTVFKKGNK